MSTTSAEEGSRRQEGTVNPTSEATYRMPSRVLSAISGASSGGLPLERDMRGLMEDTLRVDLADVRLHVGRTASLLCEELRARAFASGRHVFFKDRHYKPATGDGLYLLAHELVHVIQQRYSLTDTGRLVSDPADHSEGEATCIANTIGARKRRIDDCQPLTVSERPESVPLLQRVVELRAPGGKSSAFNRRQQLIDRMNRLSSGVTYWLEASTSTLRMRNVNRSVIRYRVVAPKRITPFDRQMMEFIDARNLVPLRLVTGSGYVWGGAGFQPLTFDSFIQGYVDLDDLQASDDLGFQALMIHFVRERLSADDYARRLGTPGLAGAFNRGHQLAHQAEARFFRDTVGDPTIRFLYAEPRPNGTWVQAFKSNEGYRIFLAISRAGREVRGARVWAQARDKRRLTVDQLAAERLVRP